MSLRGALGFGRSSLLLAGDCFVAHLPWRAVPGQSRTAPRNDIFLGQAWNGTIAWCADDIVVFQFNGFALLRI